jgi:hypothetical protein
MQWISLGLALLGIGLAVAIPLAVEFQRRPRLRVDVGHNADHSDPDRPDWRIVHVQVFNDPIEGRFAKWLLRNTASGCHVHLRLRSVRTGRRTPEWRGKWSARPEPIQYFVVTHANGTEGVHPFFDPQKEPAMYSYDLPAGEDGESVAVAIKHDGDPEGYSYAVGVYHNLQGGLKAPALALPDDEYEVVVRARAGEVAVEQSFVLRNDGTDPTGLELRVD